MSYKIAPVIDQAEGLVSVYERRIRDTEFHFSLWMTEVIVEEIAPVIAEIRHPKSVYGKSKLFPETSPPNPLSVYREGAQSCYWDAPYHY